jgi:hypothetical protein
MELMMMCSYKNFLIFVSMLMGGTTIVFADTSCNITCNVVEVPQKITIINDTEHVVHVDLPIPERTQADITLKKFKSPQELLHEAVIADSAEKIKQALFAGADINQGREGKSALLWAIHLNNYKALEALLECGAKPDNTCLQQYYVGGNAKFLWLLIKHCHLDVDLEKVLAVFHNSFGSCSISQNIFLDCIKELVDRGHNINEIWRTAIFFAQYNLPKAEEVIRHLVIRGANPNYIFRVNKGHRSATSTPLLDAAGHWPNKNIIKILLEAGVDINQKIAPFYNNEKSYTPLSYIIESCKSLNHNKRKEVIEFLLEHGASL